LGKKKLLRQLFEDGQRSGLYLIVIKGTPESQVVGLVIIHFFEGCVITNSLELNFLYLKVDSLF